MSIAIEPIAISPIGAPATGAYFTHAQILFSGAVKCKDNAATTFAGAVWSVADALHLPGAVFCYAQHAVIFNGVVSGGAQWLTWPGATWAYEQVRCDMAVAVHEDWDAAAGTASSFVGESTSYRFVGSHV
jgi:hypothetical protein